MDVVLNSLAEEKLQASLRLLAQHGRFLEIGKFDLSNNTALGEWPWDCSLSLFRVSHCQYSLLFLPVMQNFEPFFGGGRGGLYDYKL